MQTTNILLLNLYPSEISTNYTYLGQHFDCSQIVTFSTNVNYQIFQIQTVTSYKSVLNIHAEMRKDNQSKTFELSNWKFVLPHFYFTGHKL